MKVHLAGSPASCGEDILVDAGLNYRLVSFYDIAMRKKTFGGAEQLNKYKHFIMDSGLFTIMFGADKKKEFTQQTANEWMNMYINHLNSTAYGNFSFVECDVQKKLGVEAAWEMRKEMKSRVNKGTIINVYHLEDENPDKLIEWADYIAVSIPELRFHVSEKERDSITKYISSKAALKGKRVHLLGCTELKMLKKYQFCYSCDSTSWLSGLRWGKIKTIGGDIKMNSVKTEGSYDSVCETSVRSALKIYSKYAGGQN